MSDDEKGSSTRRQMLRWLVGGAGSAVVATALPLRWVKDRALKRWRGPEIPTKPFDQDVLDQDHDLAG